MASYVPAKRATEYIFYVGLESVATAGAFQSSPTLASGDVKVSKDGGSLANIEGAGTFSNFISVTPSSSKMVKVTLDSTHMTADNVTIIFSDASGGEWKDLIVNIQTAARQIDDLAYPTTSGRSIDVTTTGGVGIDWGNVENPTTTVGLTGTTVATVTTTTTATNLTNAPTSGDLTATMKTSVTTAATAATPTAAAVTGAVGSVTSPVTVGTNNDKTGYALSSAGVQAIWDALTSALTTAGSIGKLLVDNINATISSRMATFSYTAPPAAGDVAAAVWAYVVEGAITAVQAYRIMLSVLAGKSTGGGTTSVSFRDTADSKNRVDATVDADGNRTAVTRDGT